MFCFVGYFGGDGVVGMLRVGSMLVRRGRRRRGFFGVFLVFVSFL